MASGHVSRANRPNTWLHRPALHVKKALASREPSTHGTSATCDWVAPRKVVPRAIEHHTRAAAMSVDRCLWGPTGRAPSLC